MANYIPTSCTDAYININNSYSLPAKCRHHIAPASRVVWLKTVYLCILVDFFAPYFIKYKKGVRKKSQGKTHQSEQSCNPQW